MTLNPDNQTARARTSHLLANSPLCNIAEPGLEIAWERGLKINRKVALISKSLDDAKTVPRSDQMVGERV
ncbi:hypothetical protein F7234_01090 [Pseudomonas putida]|uniref:hypothetical protein n=1 Tax=Pseudomonas putida TaxID=303 RepID=UPI00125F8CA5|nr:hypothetical protein [Pseudomonas putida]KAB5627006.1 hypothetical protein F7234_01090 [Pseudomonas putida]